MLAVWDGIVTNPKILNYSFDGLKDGDRWCLCMPRWIEAYNANKAPLVVLEATHVSVLEHIDLDVLQRFAVA